MVFGINSYRELCCLNLGGTTLTSSNLLLQCSSRAANRAKQVVDQIKAALAADAEARYAKGHLNVTIPIQTVFRRSADQSVGFTECLKMNTINSLAQDRLSLRLRRFNFNLDDDFRNMSSNSAGAADIKVEGDGK